MEITGSQKIKAPQQQVFQALLNPEVLKNSIPGCESTEFVNMPMGPRLKLVISSSLPGLKGSHSIYLESAEVTPYSHVVLITEPSNSMGSVKARCAVDLTSEADGSTNLHYNANAVLEGKIAATPELIIKGAIKVALDQFFKSFEKQVSAINA